MAKKAGSAAKDAADAKAKAEKGTGKKRGRPPGSGTVHKDLTEGTVSEEVFLASVKPLKKLTQEKDTAVGNLRSHRKHCEGLGINLRSMDTALRIEKMAEDLRFGHCRDADRYLKYLRVPTGTQFGLFERELPLDDEERQAKAYKDGKAAGLAGKSSKENPHHINSLSGQEWHRGWLDGQATTVKKMAPPAEGASLQ